MRTLTNLSLLMIAAAAFLAAAPPPSYKEFFESCVAARGGRGAQGGPDRLGGLRRGQEECLHGRGAPVRAGAPDQF